MITGAHSIIYSTDPDADRAFLRDVLRLSNVDVGGGWLIFGLPPAEVAVHPSEENDHHEFYLMCDDVAAFAATMAERQVTCTAVRDMGWGLLTQVTLPGGGKLGVYQPRHARPEPMLSKAEAPTSRTPSRLRRASAETAEHAEPKKGGSSKDRKKNSAGSASSASARRKRHKGKARSSTKRPTKKATRRRR